MFKIGGLVCAKPPYFFRLFFLLISDCLNDHSNERRSYLSVHIRFLSCSNLRYLPHVAWQIILLSVQYLQGDLIISVTLQHSKHRTFFEIFSAIPFFEFFCVAFPVENTVYGRYIHSAINYLRTLRPVTITPRLTADSMLSHIHYSFLLIEFKVVRLSGFDKLHKRWLLIPSAVQPDEFKFFSFFKWQFILSEIRQFGSCFKIQRI